MLPSTAGRRSLLQGITALGTGVLLSGCGPAKTRLQEAGGKPEESISPAEDLMREHGVLDRVLLIYEDALAKMEKPGDFKPETLSSAARIVRTFVEDYHEKLEENYLFPRFEHAGTLVELVTVLRQQHLAGRRLTDTIEKLCAEPDIRKPESKRRLSRPMTSFIRMYRPHAAREDTVLFPALHKIVSPHEYGALGEEFEDQEHKLFGQDGFGKMVDEVAGLEKEVGIHDLAHFTPAAG